MGSRMQMKMTASRRLPSPKPLRMARVSSISWVRGTRMVMAAIIL